MALSFEQVSDAFKRYRGKAANSAEYEKYKNLSLDKLEESLNKPWEGNEGFINEMFKRYRGVPATEQEMQIYRTAPVERLMSDLINDPNNIQTNPISNLERYDEFSDTQREALEPEFKVYYDEQLQKITDKVKQRMARTGEDEDTAIRRVQEDEGISLDALALQKKRFEQNLEQQSSDFNEDLGEQRTYLAEDEARDIAAFDRTAQNEKQALTRNLNSRGVLVGDAFQQGTVVTNAQAKQQESLDDRFNRLQATYGRKESALDKNEERFNRGIKQTEERKEEDFGLQKSSIERSADRRLEDLNKQKDRNVTDLDDYLEEKKEALEQDKETKINNTILQRYQLT